MTNSNTLLKVTPNFLFDGDFWRSYGFSDTTTLVWDGGAEVSSIRLFKIPKNARDSRISRALPEGHFFSPQELYMLLASDLAKLSRGEQGLVLNDENATYKMGLHFYVDPGEFSGVPKLVVFAEFIPCRSKWYFEKYRYDDEIEWKMGSVFVARVERS